MTSPARERVIHGYLSHITPVDDLPAVPDGITQAAVAIVLRDDSLCVFALLEQQAKARAKPGSKK